MASIEWILLPPYPSKAIFSSHCIDTPAPGWAQGKKNRREKLGAARCGSRSSLFGLLYSFSGRRSLPPALSLRRRCRRFANQFRRHDAGDKQLRAMIVKIHGSAFLIGRGHHTQSINVMLDRLSFCHCLHECLLDNSRADESLANSSIRLRLSDRVRIDRVSRCGPGHPRSTS